MQMAPGGFGSPGTPSRYLALIRPHRPSLERMSGLIQMSPALERSGSPEISSAPVTTPKPKSVGHKAELERKLEAQHLRTFRIQRQFLVQSAAIRKPRWPRV